MWSKFQDFESASPLFMRLPGLCSYIPVAHEKCFRAAPKYAGAEDTKHADSHVLKELPELYRGHMEP